MTASVRLRSLATALPPHRLPQAEIRQRVASLFRGHPLMERLLPVFANAGIDGRNAAVDAAWYDEERGWQARNARYLAVATDLLETAARAALAEAGIEPARIDHVVTVSTTGIATPSLEARLMPRLGFGESTLRTPIFGLGCGGGVTGLSRAATMAAARPGSHVLLLVVELCTLAFRQRDPDKSDIVAAALFGDGAAAAVLSTAGTGPILAGGGEQTWADTLDVMGWDVDDAGLKAIFHRDIPAFVRARLGPALAGFLGRQGLRLDDVAEFACHPGGVKVLDALEDVLQRQRGFLADSRAVLKDQGNMSAATVLFVLRRLLDRGLPGRTLAMALGPGFSAGFQLLEPA